MKWCALALAALLAASVLVAAGPRPSPAVADGGSAEAVTTIESGLDHGASAAGRPTSDERRSEYRGPVGTPQPIPDPPFQFPNGSWVCEKIGETKSLEGNVDCGPPWGVIGTIKFEYYLQKGVGPGLTCDSPATSAGAVVWGGFDKNEGVCDPEPGWYWTWVQIVKSSDPLAFWGAGPGEWYVDSSDTNNPEYGCCPATGYDCGLEDWPCRPLPPPETGTTWYAEAALVCINVADEKMKVAGSFVWGFKITAAGDVEEGDWGAPDEWGPASATFYQTLAHEWDPTPQNPTGGDYADWTVTAGCCCTQTSEVEESSWGMIKALYR